MWDGLGGVPGLGIRVTDKGAKSFVLATRYPGSKNPTRRALGAYGELTLEQARERARGWLALIQKGVDPTDEEERQRLAEQRKRENSFAAVAEDFIIRKVRFERQGSGVERTIRKVLIPAWGKRAITEITALDVINLIRPIKERAPYMAHATLGYARRLFSWAIEQHAYGIEASPCERLKPEKIIGKKKPRSRVLTDDELRAFWRAAGRMSYPFGPLLRMLLYTGARHMEVAAAPWAEFDMVKRLWTVSPERFKSDTPHQVPLVADVVALLDGLPRVGAFVFSANGERGTEFHYKAKNRLDARMLRTLKAMSRRRGEDPSKIELRPWVIHDLRRVVRSHLSALRVPDHVAEMVIGHGRQGLQRVYDAHAYEAEKREALALWARRLRDLVEVPPANVVKLDKARG